MYESYLRLKKRKVPRDILLVCLADGVVAMSYGAVSVGSSEFLFAGIVASGGSPVAAALAGILVNIRHLPFGLSVSSSVGKGPMRFLGYHIMNDESVVFGVSQPTEEERMLSYWLCGLGIFVLWPFGVYIGGTLGSLIDDPSVFGLDAMLPAIILALVLPNLHNRQNLVASLSGAVVAVISVPFLPIGLPSLLSLTGIWIGRKLA